MPWKVPAGDALAGQGRRRHRRGDRHRHRHLPRVLPKPDGTTRILELWDQTAGWRWARPAGHFPRRGQVYVAAQSTRRSLPVRRSSASTRTATAPTWPASPQAMGARTIAAASRPLCRGRAGGRPGDRQRNRRRPAQRRRARCRCAPARRGLPVNKPVVINCSFGHDTGPHDGAGALGRRSTAAAAGGRHARGTGSRRRGRQRCRRRDPRDRHRRCRDVTVPFYVRTARTARHLDIWYNGRPPLRVEIIAPPNPALPGTNTTGQSRRRRRTRRNRTSAG